MSSRLTSLCLVFFLVSGGLIGFASFRSRDVGGTDVGGPITVHTTWDLAGSPYIVVGEVIVVIGVQLTIEPGVEVRFDGFYNITVHGTFMAIGTKMDNIFMTSHQKSPASGDWKSIRVSSYGHAEIMYCNLSYSNFGIQIYTSSTNIVSNNTLSFNNVGIYIRESSSDNIVTHNKLINNGEGIIVRDSSDNNTITHNDLLNNECGIRVVYSSNNILISNNLENNELGIYLGDSSYITLTDNIFFNNGIYIHSNNNQIQHYNSHTIPVNNMVNGKPVYYYKNTSGIIFDSISVGQLILANCTDFDVKNLQINNTDLGILVAFSTNISISNSNLSWNNGVGIHLYSSSNNKIINNNISNGDWGIDMRQSSNNNTIKNNNILSNDRIGIGIGDSSHNNVIEKNTITSNNMTGLEIGLRTNDDSSNNTVTDNRISNNNRGIRMGKGWMEISVNNTITGNQISNNNYGIYLNMVFDNKINRNVFSNNNWSIYLHWSSRNIVSNNIISEGEYGIFFYESSNDNIITGNTISNHDYGAYLDHVWCRNNIIYHNNFINNVNQSLDYMGYNIWNDSYSSAGNYWSDFDEPGEGAFDDYHGPNQDIPGSDGIVDNGTAGGGGKNPYFIHNDSQDNYPLMYPWVSSMRLYHGWNLISIPFIQLDTDLDRVLSSIGGYYDAVQWFNALEPNDRWKHNHISKPSILNDLSDINHTMGFWIHITDPDGTILEYNGLPFRQNQSIVIHKGWNHVGFPSLSSKNRTVGLNNLIFGSDVDMIQTYDAATKTWEEIGPSDEFEIGRGYWVHSKVETVWDVPL